MSYHRDRELRLRIPLVLFGTSAVMVALLLGLSRLPLHPAERPLFPPAEAEGRLVEVPSPPTAAAPAPPPVAQPKPEATPLPRPKPQPRQPPLAPPSSAHPQSANEVPPAQTVPSPSSQTANGPSGNTGGARAIFQPAPEIPSELRRHTMALTVVVRFSIAADGTTTAELEEATPDPQLNQVLLSAFRRWRFFPAMEDGRPVPSMLTLKVPVRVE